MEEKTGVIERAVRAHNPTQAVLDDAVALDRELDRAPTSYEKLLPQVSSFIESFSSLLLHESGALETLATVCITACSSAPSASDRTRSAVILSDLMLRLCQEIQREGVVSVPRDVPAYLAKLIKGLNESFHDTAKSLIDPLLELGQVVVLMAEEANPPEAWFKVLCALDGLLLSIFHRLVSNVSSRPSEGGQLSKTPGDGMSRLDELQKQLMEPDASCSEVFMDIVCYEKQTVDYLNGQVDQ